MAVGANSYGSVARIEGLIGDLVASRTFSATTIPTTTEVEAFIDDIAAQINVALEQAGYTVPVATATNAAAHAYLVSVNSMGAAALILATQPAEAYVEPGDESPAQGRRQYYQSRLREAIKLIGEQKLPAARDTGLAARIFAGSQEDADGNTKKPIFTRAMSDYPGSRTLTE